MSIFHLSATNTWLLLLSILSGISGCTDTDQINQQELNHAYELLYLAHFGLEYPPRPDVLKICQEKRIAECLRVYQLVQNGKQTLLTMIAHNPEAAFSYTLATINQACLKIVPAGDQQTIFQCHGAVTALYFFTDPSHDKRLRDWLAQASTPIMRAMLGERYEWFYNRPNADDWVAIINSLPASALTDAEKRPIVEFFKESRRPYVQFGVML